MLEWLAGAATAENSAPSFVAVEWSHGAQTKVDLERPRFGRIAAGIWGDGVSAELLHRLAQTVGWEADTHRQLYPGLAPLYLDPPRRRTSHAIDAGLYLDIFRQRLDGYHGDRNDVDAAIAWIHERCIEAASGDIPDFGHRAVEREDTWLARLTEAFPANVDGWGMAVVGALHATALDNDTFHQLALAAGYAVEHRYLQGWDPEA